MAVGIDNFGWFFFVYLTRIMENLTCILFLSTKNWNKPFDTNSKEVCHTFRFCNETKQ